MIGSSIYDSMDLVEEGLRLGERGQDMGYVDDLAVKAKLRTACGFSSTG